MVKKGIFILIGIIAILALFFFLSRTANNSLSLTRQIDAQTIEYDSEVPCSTVDDCSKIQDFPSDGYCAEGTCRMKLNTADLYPKDLTGLGGQ